MFLLALLHNYLQLLDASSVSPDNNIPRFRVKVMYEGMSLEDTTYVERIPTSS